MHTPILQAARAGTRKACARALRWALGMAVGLWVAAGLAHAQSQALGALAQQWAQAAAVQAAPSGVALRLEVQVGEADARLKLAPCAKVEPYLPTGARLWGRSRVGLRCVDGPMRWNITLPLEVKAFGPAWLVRGNVAAGAVLDESDLVQGEADWAQASQAVLFEPSAWLGQVATRPLGTGQVLREGMVRPAQVFAAGAQVRVVAKGPGFEVAGLAQALSAGVLGQTARVRMDNGRIASGTVLDARTVLLAI